MLFPRSLILLPALASASPLGQPVLSVGGRRLVARQGGGDAHTTLSGDPDSEVAPSNLPPSEWQGGLPQQTAGGAPAANPDLNAPDLSQFDGAACSKYLLPTIFMPKTTPGTPGTPDSAPLPPDLATMIQELHESNEKIRQLLTAKLNDAHVTLTNLELTPSLRATLVDDGKAAKPEDYSAVAQQLANIPRQCPHSKIIFMVAGSWAKSIAKSLPLIKTDNKVADKLKSAIVLNTLKIASLGVQIADTLKNAGPEFAAKVWQVCSSKDARCKGDPNAPIMDVASYNDELDAASTAIASGSKGWGIYEFDSLDANTLHQTQFSDFDELNKQKIVPSLSMIFGRIGNRIDKVGIQLQTDHKRLEWGGNGGQEKKLDIAANDHWNYTEVCKSFKKPKKTFKNARIGYVMIRTSGGGVLELGTKGGSGDYAPFDCQSWKAKDDEQFIGWFGKFGDEIEKLGVLAMPLHPVDETPGSSAAAVLDKAEAQGQIDTTPVDQPDSLPADDLVDQAGQTDPPPAGINESDLPPPIHEDSLPPPPTHPSLPLSDLPSDPPPSELPSSELPSDRDTLPPARDQDDLQDDLQEPDPDARLDDQEPRLDDHESSAPSRTSLPAENSAPLRDDLDDGIQDNNPDRAQDRVDNPDSDWQHVNSDGLDDDRDSRLASTTDRLPPSENTGVVG